MLEKIKKCLKNPLHILTALSTRGFFNWMSDSFYLRMIFRAEMEYFLNVKNPKTFNEKIQWLKLYGNLEKYTDLVDKYEVRKYIAKTIGEEYLIPLIGVWDRFEDIDFEKLPEQFVLKCNHDCGSVVICKDKSSFDIRKARNKLNECLKQNFYYLAREPQYKNIKPKIICEKYMGDNFDDYKIFVFNGKPDNIMVCIGRQTSNLQFYFFDLNWNLLRLNYWGLNAPLNFTLPKPEKLEEMIRIAEVLSRGTHFLRIDLYQENNQVYFGELTFTPQAGFDANLLQNTDIMFGEKILLPLNQETNAQKVNKKES